ncbi:retrotransposable element Tf2 protein type 3 [Trichonephila clavipes]|nr:retrotransposable element Tf2 protein type 3 [Trichonephila clavipes]
MPVFGFLTPTLPVPADGVVSRIVHRVGYIGEATALKTILPWKTTLSGRSHQSTHPKHPSFPEFDLNKFSSCKSFMDCFDQQCLEYQKEEQWKKAKFEWDDDEGILFITREIYPFSSPNQIKRWGLKRKFKEQVTYEYNNSTHDVTGFPPAYLMFGTLPYDSPLPNQVKLNYPPIQQARQIAVNRTIKHHKINKQRYDKHYVDAKFKVGDLVLYQNFSYPNSSKLQSPYNGPFKVVRKSSNVTYEIDKPNQYTGKLTDIVHSTRLKPFHSKKSNFQLC